MGLYVVIQCNGVSPKTHSSVHQCRRKGNFYGSRHWSWRINYSILYLEVTFSRHCIAELCNPVELIITVVDGNGPSLLGRDWLQQLRLWTQISMVQNSSTQLEDFMKEYSEIFRDELGTV